jgi:hypothetical protein
VKILLAILLFFILIIPLAGSFIFIHYNQNRIRQEVGSMISSVMDEKDLILLKFSKDEIRTRFNWKHDREFEYDGQMYDITDQWQEGDSVYYQCYSDLRETRWNNEKQRLIAKALGQDPSQKKQAEKIKNYFNTLFSQDTFAWKPAEFNPSNFLSPVSNFQFPSVSLSPPAPPPKFG